MNTELAHRQTSGLARAGLGSRKRTAIRRATGPVVENLEERRLLAAPEIAELPISLPAPVGKTLILPIAVDDADGDAVSLTASLTSGPGDAALDFVNRNNTFVEVDVAQFGVMTFQLFNDIAPNGSSLFASLGDTGFYDNLIIPRVDDDFVIQFGSPFATEGDNN
ncbi:MAG: peptidylprolyl isomerase, partial [Planctomycetota bacterium]